MVDLKKFNDIDLYGLLEIESTAQEPEIRKAYRKKALSCHPDKNPDDKKAAERFQELTRALEVLLDKTARAAYDRLQNAKKSAEIRHRQLDAKRQKLKSELEERERQAQEKAKSSKTAEQQFQEELERLRKDGNRIVEEEKEAMRKQMQEDRFKATNIKPTWDSSKHRVKIKWNAEKNDPTNGGYDEAKLRQYLKKYGELVALVMSPKKNGSALVEFKNQQLAELAVKFEMGNLQNPLKLEWLSDAPDNSKRRYMTETMKESDFESMTERQKRQAEERKRLIEQMKREEMGLN